MILPAVVALWRNWQWPAGDSFERGVLLVKRLIEVRDALAASDAVRFLAELGVELFEKVSNFLVCRLRLAT